MARPKKLWRPLRAWHPLEWVSMKEAWQRVEAAVKSWSLTKRDLRLDLIGRRLVAAVRRIAKDGTETRIILEPAYCRRLELPYAWLVRGWEAEAQEGEAWHFFVRRHELDRFYPAVAAADAAPPPEFRQPTPSTMAEPSADDKPRRKPGPKPKHDWPTQVTRELIRRARAGEPDPSAPEMLQWCEDKWGWQPDLKQMQQLLRDLLA